jgi:hypothetical protein
MKMIDETMPTAMMNPAVPNMADFPRIHGAGRVPAPLLLVANYHARVH